MRRTIRGNCYDTETATCVGERQVVRGDGWFVESLYVTVRGRWFLHGSGGPDSLWGQWERTGARSDGESIRALSAESAQIWLGRYGQDLGGAGATRTGGRALPGTPRRTTRA